MAPLHRLFHRVLQAFLCSLFLLAAAARVDAQGNFKMEVHYSGDVDNMTASSGIYVSVANSINGGPLWTTPFPLESTGNDPPETFTGGITGKLSVRLSAYTEYDSWGSVMQSAGASPQRLMTLSIAWQPKNGDIAADPPPSRVRLVYWRKLKLKASVSAADGAEARAYGQIKSDGLTLTTRHLSVPPGGSDADDLAPIVEGATEVILPINPDGTATYSLPAEWYAEAEAMSPANQWGMSASGGDAVPDIPAPPPDFRPALATVDADWWYHLYLRGVEPTRGTHRGAGAAGQNTAAGSDPTFTRWIPLAFSPVISSQPFRNYMGTTLQDPWGNVNCLYSIAVHQERVPETNLDTEAAYFLYDPDPDANGNYDNPSRPPKPGRETTAGTWPLNVVMDANGDRLVFSGIDNLPHRDVYSQLVMNGADGTFELRNAGPPGMLRYPGSYTYRFLPIDPVTRRALMVSISDSDGNQQNLAWTPTSLTVTDQTSGRQLLFSKVGSGYYNRVEAPASGGYPGTVTQLGWDGGGHMTSLDVYLAGSNTPVRSDRFTYSGDAIMSVQQGGAEATYTYVSGLILDPWGNPIPRVSGGTIGSAADTTSSDSGNVQGVWQLDYGPVTAGLNSYGIDKRTSTLTDARGNVFKVTYSFPVSLFFGEINKVEVTGPDFTGAPAGSNTWRVDYVNNIAWLTRMTINAPLNLYGVADFDNHGNLTQWQDFNGYFLNFWYTADGKNLTRYGDPNLVNWYFEYGPQNTLSRVTGIRDNANNLRAEISYNAFAQPEMIRIPAAASASGLNEETWLTYDATKGDLTKAVDPMGDALTVNSYDALGDPLSVSVFPDTGNPLTSQNPLNTLIDWDAAQQMIWTKLPNQTTVSNTWTNGLVTHTESRTPGNTLLSFMDFLYDTRGRLYRANDSVGTAAQYRYDKNSNLTQVWDGRSNITRFGFGPNDEPIWVKWPDNYQANGYYDAAGRLVRTVDERGTEALYNYTAFRLDGVTFPATPSQNLSITWAGAGLPGTITDSTGSTTFGYEPTFKRLTSITTNLGGQNYQVTYSYYPDGKRQSMTSPAGTVSYVYDRSGRLTNLSAPNHSTAWIYDHAGRMLSEVTAVNGGAIIETLYAYGVSGRQDDPFTAPAYLRTIEQRVNGLLRQKYTLTHTYLGQLAIQQSEGAIGEPLYFWYDGRGRLSSCNETGAPDFSYDLSNNLFPGASTWVYNASNQLTSAPSNPALPGATGLQYDQAGNLRMFSGKTLTWNPWGRLSNIFTPPNGNVSFTNDFAGRRVSKTASGVTTYYLYDGDLLIAELNSLGVVQRSYTWGAAGLISDTGPTDQGVQPRFYLFDALGNTRLLLKTTGATYQTAYWQPWGTSAFYPDTPMGWNGRYGVYRDSETGLHYMMNRYYMPSIARFVSRDPICFTGGINLYAYCNDDPINLADPMGLDPGYWEQAWGFFKGELFAADPRNWIEGGRAAVNHIRNHGWSGVGDVASGFWDGLQFWNKTDPYQAGQGFMGDVLLVVPAAKRIPTPQFIANISKGIGARGSAVPLAFGALLNKLGICNRAVRIIERDGNTAWIEAVGPKGRIEVMAEMSKEGDTLTLNGMHIDGPGPGSMGLGELRAFAEKFARQQKVRRIVVNGAARTTGRRPGHTPRPVMLDF